MDCILDHCSELPTRTVGPGEVLLAEGERTDLLYILVEGKLEVVKGALQVHVAAEPGAVFGEISALLGIPHTATVKALSRSRVHVVHNASHFLQSHPEIAFHLSRMLAQRLHGLTSYLADLKAQFADQANHLGMVDDVLGTLLHQQPAEFLPGSARHPDPKL